MAFKKYQKIIIFSLSLLIILVLLAFIILKPRINNRNEEIKSLKINKQVLQVEIADTVQERYLGLSNRSFLCADCGLLFLFEKLETRQFVMRNMNFPLDIIFIENDVIVKIAKNLSPEGSDPKNLYYSDFPVDKVLEVNAEVSDQYNFQVGQKVIFLN